MVAQRNSINDTVQISDRKRKKIVSDIVAQHWLGDHIDSQTLSFEDAII